jgi:hypothetical protein
MGWIKEIACSGDVTDERMTRGAELQPRIYPLPTLRRPWFKRGRIICDEGWSVSYSGSSWRIDRYDYYENDRHLILSGEGGSSQMDIFIDAEMFWDDTARVRVEETDMKRVLNNLTAALQWDGFEVGFFRTDLGSNDSHG